MLYSFEVKSEISKLLACLLSPPDREITDALNSNYIFERLSDFFLDNQVRLYFLRDRNFSEEELSDDYYYSFFEKKVSLIESFYKPWTEDRECRSVMAGEKGLLMGDHALHMKALYEMYNLEISFDISTQPDHLVFELDFLSFLYTNYSKREALQFITDHLDWTSDLYSESRKAGISEFYGEVIGTVDFFVENEKAGLDAYN